MTAEAKHTPGPWAVYKLGNVHIGYAETGEAICAMWGDNEEGEANAAHIVRCVNSHDALLAVVEAMGDNSISDQEFNEMRRSALSKAKGDGNA